MLSPVIENSNDQKKWNKWLLYGAVVIYFFVNFQRSSIPGTIFNELQSDFSATAAQVTLISAVFMYVYAATQLVAGLVSDKFGGARTILVGGALFCIGSFIEPLCGNLMLLLFARVLVGIGAGAIYLALVKEIDRIYPDKFTSVLGSVILLGYCGSIFGGFPLSKAVSVVSWRLVFGVAGVLSLLGFAAFVFCCRKVNLPKVRSEKLSIMTFAVIIRSRNCQKLFLSGGVGYAVYYLMLAVMGKKILEDICGTSPGVAGACLSLMVVVSGGLNYLFGYLSTRLGNIRKPFVVGTMAASVIGAVMGLIGLQIQAGTWYFVIVMQLFAASAGFSSVTNSLMREYSPAEYTGSGASVLNFVAYLAVAICGNLAGYLMDTFAFGKARVAKEINAVIYPASSYQAVFVLSLFIALIALAAAFTLPETRGKNLYESEKLQRSKQKDNK